MTTLATCQTPTPRIICHVKWALESALTLGLETGEELAPKSALTLGAEMGEESALKLALTLGLETGKDSASTSALTGSGVIKGFGVDGGISNGVGSGVIPAMGFWVGATVGF